MPENELLQVYNATSASEQKQAYNSWAADYERDLCNMGYRLPAIIAAVFARFVDIETSPILDAGCGGGMQTEPLSLLGYTGITGIDLSEGMLEIARQKALYKELHQMVLGEPLDFADHRFSAVISSGTITPGHAPPETFSELIRVTKPDGLIIFSLRVDAEQDPAYAIQIDKHSDAKHWQHIYTTPAFQTMPYGEPLVKNCVQVYKVLA